MPSNRSLDSSRQKYAFFIKVNQCHTTENCTSNDFSITFEGSGLLLCSAAGNSATILAPFIADIEFGIYNCTPYIIFAVFGIASSGFTIAYEIETLGQPLLNTEEEFFVAAKVGRIQKHASHATDE